MSRLYDSDRRGTEARVIPMTLSEFLDRFPRQTKVGDQVNVTCPAHDRWDRVIDGR